MSVQIVNISSCQYSMFRCSDQVKYFVVRFFFLSISGLVIQSTGNRNLSPNTVVHVFCFSLIETYSLFSIREENYCPFVETASFGSDINIKCNDTYLEFNEINVTKYRIKRIIHPGISVDIDLRNQLEIC